MNGGPGLDACHVVLELADGGESDFGDEVFGEFEDLTSVEGNDRVTGGGFGELADLAVVDAVLDPTLDARQGSIIVVGGHVGELLEGGANLVAEEAPDLQALHGQLELITAAEEEGLVDPVILDDGDADSAGADDEDSASGSESAGGSPDGGGDASPEQ